MSKLNEEADVLSMFGLTGKQTRIMFSIEKLLVQNDILNSKKDIELKEKWLNEWCFSVLDYLTKASPNIPSTFMTRTEVLEAIAQEHSLNINNTWYYLIMLEATLFVPYTALGKPGKDDKKYATLKYKDQSDLIKDLVRTSVIMDEVFIDRFKNTYKKSISKLTGKSTKLALYLVGVVAITAIAAASAGTLAGPIAVTIFGSQFAGLSGAALTSACLAMAGGGAIAAGGAGMAGGVISIVGGGALIGAASGLTAAGGVTLIAKSVPELALTQSAKLEVVLKEIILNAQQDIKCAQVVLENYKNQIASLQSELTIAKLDCTEKNKDIANLKKTIEYMEKSYRNTAKFMSSYIVGLGLQD